MARPAEQRWILLRKDGEVAAQLVIAGQQTPSEVGDNPDGLAEIKVKRHGELVHEHYDQAKGRWISDPKRREKAERSADLRRLDRAELFDLIVAEVRRQLQPEIDALAARIPAERKGD